MSVIYLRIFIIISRHQKGRRLNHDRSTLTRGIVSASGPIGTATAVNLAELIAKKGDDNKNNNNFDGLEPDGVANSKKNNNNNNDDVRINNVDNKAARAFGNNHNSSASGAQIRCAACAARALHDEDDPTISMFGEPTIEAEQDDGMGEEKIKKVTDDDNDDLMESSRNGLNEHKELSPNKSTTSELKQQQQQLSPVVGVKNLTPKTNSPKNNTGRLLSRLQSNNVVDTASLWDDCSCHNNKLAPKTNTSNKTITTTTTRDPDKRQVKLIRSNTVGETCTSAIVRKFNTKPADKGNNETADNNSTVSQMTNLNTITTSQSNSAKQAPHSPLLTPINMVTVSIASQRSSSSSSAVAPSSSLRSHLRRSPTSQSHSINTDYRSNQTINVTTPMYSNNQSPHHQQNHQHYHRHHNQNCNIDSSLNNNNNNNSTKFPFVSQNFNSSSTYEPQRRHIHASAVPQTNTKALVTTLLILGTYFISYIPAIVFQVLTCVDYCPYPLYDISFSRRIVLASATTLLLIAKSIIDPFIYSYRMSEIQVAVTRYISKRRSKTSSMHVTNQRLTMSLHHNNSNNPNNMIQTTNQNDTSCGTSSFRILNNNNNNNKAAAMRSNLNQLTAVNQKQQPIQSKSLDSSDNKTENSRRSNFIAATILDHKNKLKQHYDNNDTHQTQLQEPTEQTELIEKQELNKQQNFNFKSDINENQENKSNLSSSRKQLRLVSENFNELIEENSSEHLEAKVKINNSSDVKDKSNLDKKVIKVSEGPAQKDASYISYEKQLNQQQLIPIKTIFESQQEVPTTTTTTGSNELKQKYSVGIVLIDNEAGQNVIGPFPAGGLEKTPSPVKDTIPVEGVVDGGRSHKHTKHKHKHHHHHHHHRHHRHNNDNNNDNNDNSQQQINSTPAASNLIC